MTGMESRPQDLSLRCSIITAKYLIQSGPLPFALLEFALALCSANILSSRLTTSSKKRCEPANTVSSQCQANGNARAAGIPQTYDCFAIDMNRTIP
jgi:hypothetical protein